MKCCEKILLIVVMSVAAPISAVAQMRIALLANPNGVTLVHGNSKQVFPGLNDGAVMIDMLRQRDLPDEYAKKLAHDLTMLSNCAPRQYTFVSYGQDLTYADWGSSILQVGPKRPMDYFWSADIKFVQSALFPDTMSLDDQHAASAMDAVHQRISRFLSRNEAMLHTDTSLLYKLLR